MTHRDELEPALRQQIKNALNTSIETLDAATRARLRTARAQALQARSSREPWLWWSIRGVTLAAIALLSWALWFQGPARHTSPALEQLELLSSAENLELYTDLDFYQWLASDTDADAS